jgi:hypothetical protein
MHIKIAELKIPELSSSRLLRNTDRYLMAAISHIGPRSSLSPAKCSFLETDVGTATLVLRRALKSSTADPQAWNQHWRYCADTIRAVVRQARKERSGTVSIPPAVDDGDCEVLYGRAGLLYALLSLRSTITSDHAVGTSPEILSTITELASDSNIQRLVNAIILRGKTGSTLYRSEFPTQSIPALMWSWHGKRYLGAAHGVGMPSLLSHNMVRRSNAIYSWYPAHFAPLPRQHHNAACPIHFAHRRIALVFAGCRWQLALICTFETWSAK